MGGHGEGASRRRRQRRAKPGGPRWLVLGRLAQTAVYGLLATAVLLAVLACPRLAEAQTVDELGSVTFRVGSASAESGYRDSGLGSLVSGDWPGALFTDGQDRTVTQVTEDALGAAGPRWWFMATGWKSAAALDDVTVTVTYEDGVDDRSFVLGGFIDGAILEPPIPSVDWADRAGELVTLAFSRRVAAAAPATPAPLVAPATEPDSFAEWLSATTPGGPVMVQLMIVLIVFVGFILTAPATPWGLIMGAVVLTMTGWVPVLFGFGSTIAASIVAVNVVVGAYTYKAWAARTEA